MKTIFACIQKGHEALQCAGGYDWNSGIQASHRTKGMARMSAPLNLRDEAAS